MNAAVAKVEVVIMPLFVLDIAEHSTEKATKLGIVLNLREIAIGADLHFN